MVLNYDLSFFDVAVQKGDPHIPMNATAIKNKSSVVAYVALDAQRRVVKTAWIQDYRNVSISRPSYRT